MALAKDSDSDGSSDVTPIRDAAKWLLTAFAGVGAVLLGGVQFSALGKLSGPSLDMALLGVLLGLLGVGIAIWWTSLVLVTRIVSVTGLENDAEAREFIDARPDIVGRQYASLKAFSIARQAAWAKWNDPRPHGTADSVWSEQRKALSAELEHLENVATRIAQIWKFEIVCERFTQAQKAAFAGAAMAALGILLFTCARPEGPDPLPKNPTAVSVFYRLTEGFYQTVSRVASKQCVPQTGVATLLDGWPNGSDVLIASNEANCAPVRVRWNSTLGTLSASPATLPEPKQSKATDHTP
jgi:hypothetical protein